MTPEETMKKAIEIARSNGRQGIYHEDEEKYPELWCYECAGYCYTDGYEMNKPGPRQICCKFPEEQILFNRGFREALVGKEFVYPKAMEFSTTGYISHIKLGEHHMNNNPYGKSIQDMVKIEMSIADYNLQRIAVSDDRIGYLQSVLDSLENK